MGRCLNCHSVYEGEERFCPLDGGAVVEGDPEDPLIGQTIDGRYLIREQLGEGGMGAVYRADHINIDKTFAIKFILDKYTEEQEVVSRFHREARTAASVGHPAIVNVIDFGKTEKDRHFIVMEMLEGIDLGKAIKENGRLRPARAIKIARQLLSGLSAAHAKGVVHRDLKPENVFLVPVPSGEQAKLMDFGISKIMTAHDSQVRLTGTGTVVGTPTYIAPEQATGEESVDHRADLYSLGVMLYEMLAGQPPFMASNYLSLVTKHLHEMPKSLSVHVHDIPQSLVAAVDRALVKDPEQRFGSASEFEAALLVAAQELGDRNTGPTKVPMEESQRFAPTAMRGAAAVHSSASFEPPRRSAKWVWIAAAVLVFAAAGGATALILSNSKTSSQDSNAVAAAATATTDIDASVKEEAPSVAPLAGATLNVESSPAGAKVYIDAAYRGETPLQLLDITANEVEIRLELDGFAMVTARKTLRAGERETFFVPLSKEIAAKNNSRRKRPRPASKDREVERDSTPKKPSKPAQRPPKPNKPKKPNKPRDSKPNPYL